MDFTFGWIPYQNIWNAHKIFHFYQRNDLKCIPKHLKRIQYFPYIIVPKQQFLQIWDPDFLKSKRIQLFLFCGFYLRLNSIPKHLKRTQNFPLLPKDAKCLTNDRKLLLVNPPPHFSILSIFWVLTRFCRFDFKILQIWLQNCADLTSRIFEELTPNINADL